MNFLPEEIQKYCTDHSAGDSPILEKLTRYTIDNIEGAVMLSGAQVGNVLQGFSKMSSAKRILEIGMYTGYSALKFAEAIPEDGEVHTCELSENHCRTAQSFFDQSPSGKKITIHQGKALTTIEKFPVNSFDIAFIDADKLNYTYYYQRCMLLLKSGGIIVLDNMLWSGTVLDPQDEDAKALRDIGELIQQDSRCFNFLLPVRDGLMVCIKR